ncbi:hypothetical protein MKMG_02209 [Methanogenium sp. MK-MG]|nr:hypothetical protein MKMG_02209 [Methanogenium sp. MK-MG]
MHACCKSGTENTCNRSTKPGKRRDDDQEHGKFDEQLQVKRVGQTCECSDNRQDQKKRQNFAIYLKDWFIEVH